MENLFHNQISVNPLVMGGTPVFRGTRVPVATLFQYLEKNYSLDEFLDCFPTVTKDAAISILAEAEEAAIEKALS